MIVRAILLGLAAGFAMAGSAAGQSTGEVRWRNSTGCATCQPTASPKGCADKRVFCKPASAREAVAETPRIERPATPPPVRRAIAAVEPTVVAIIRRDDAGTTDGRTLEREIKLAILDHTREFRVETDCDGRLVVTATLPDVSDWADLVARIRAMPELGRHVVIVRGIVK